jgi:hypothetical protein
MKRIISYGIFSTVLSVITLLIFAFSSSYIVEASGYSISVSQSLSTIEHPSVVLQDGTDNVSNVYMNETSAKIDINVNASLSTYDHTLNIVNNGVNLSEVRLEYFSYSGLNCTNATIILHDNSSSLWQIKIQGGNISQNSTYNDLAGNTTIYIGVQDLMGNVNGTTILHTHLRIKTPNKTTYALYEIAFEFKYNT